MLYLTQSKTWDGKTLPARGNCWQTAVACILGVPAEQLPDQVDVEAAGHHYETTLRKYLLTHHDMHLGRLVLNDFHLPIQVLDVPSILCGPTVRTSPANRNMHHCVVGNGLMQVWDPHPSRAGLLSLREAQFIVDAKGVDLGWLEKHGCMCPLHGGIPPKAPPKPPEYIEREFARGRGIVTIKAEAWLFDEIAEISFREAEN